MGERESMVPLPNEAPQLEQARLLQRAQERDEGRAMLTGENRNRIELLIGALRSGKDPSGDPIDADFWQACLEAEIGWLMRIEFANGRRSAEVDASRGNLVHIRVDAASGTPAPDLIYF